MAEDPSESTESATTDPDAGDTGKVEGAADAADEKSATDKPVVRKKVVSKRVTPKGGPVNAPNQGRSGKGATKGSTAAHAHAPDGDDAGYSGRYTPPTAKYADGPSPMWVPVLMFALLALGSLLIIANYAQLFGDPSNTYLIVGLVLILGGIITATNYR